MDVLNRCVDSLEDSLELLNKRFSSNLGSGREEGRERCWRRFGRH